MSFRKRPKDIPSKWDDELAPAIRPLTPRDVANMYHTSYRYVLQAILNEDLKASHLKGQKRKWYIKIEDVDDWVENNLLQKD